MTSWGGCAVNRIRGKVLDTSTNADDINQAVNRANFMEVNLIRGAAMNRRFRIS